MELLQLQYFYESAIEESFSKVAEKYNVPVSSVSATVRRLEKKLGTPLFDRTCNRIFLTEKGKLFLKTVRTILKEYDAGVRAVTCEDVPDATLSVLVYILRQRTTAKVLQFQQLYPSISFKIDLHCHDHKSATDYDVIIDSSDESYEGYDSFELCCFPIHVDAKTTDPLCQRKITLNQLRDRLFVTNDMHHGDFKIFAQACQERGFVPKVVLECNDYVCRDEYVKRGGALGITCGDTTNSILPDVQYLDVKDFDKKISVSLFYKKKAYSDAVKLFVDFIKEYRF